MRGLRDLCHLGPACLTLRCKPLQVGGSLLLSSLIAGHPATSSFAVDALPEPQNRSLAALAGHKSIAVADYLVRHGSNYLNADRIGLHESMRRLDQERVEPTSAPSIPVETAEQGTAPAVN